MNTEFWEVQLQRQKVGGPMKRFVLMAVLFVAIACLLVFTFDSTRLPNGYRVVEANPFDRFIVDSRHNVVAGPHLTDWHSEGPIVFGNLLNGRRFALDTKSGIVNYSDGLATKNGNGGFVEHAPKGYKISSDGSSFSILDKTGMVVGPIAIVDYEIVGETIVGTNSEGGKFTFDTGSGKCENDSHFSNNEIQMRSSNF
jgi:hypothetical protein